MRNISWTFLDNQSRFIIFFLRARRNTNNVSDAISALLEDTDDKMDESYTQPEDEYSFEEGSQGKTIFI